MERIQKMINLFRNKTSSKEGILKLVKNMLFNSEEYAT